MKAVTYREYGGPSVLQVEELPIPQPSTHEVLIRVHAAEVTKSDCELRSFKFPVKWFWLPLRIAIGIRRPRQSVLGRYFAGEIVAVGADVARFSTGQQVFGVTSFGGAYAEYLVLPGTGKITAKPRNMTFIEAAGVPLGGLNALHFMRLAHIQRGDAVLINGAGGSIGGHAVQIAKAMGARVTAVDHGRKRDLLRRLGADRFVDYMAENVWSERDSYDVVFDMVAGSSYTKCMRLLRRRGRYLSGNPRLRMILRSLLTNWFTKRSATFAFAKETVAELDDLREMVEKGELASFVDRVYEMEDAPEAHERVEAEHRIGTIVLAVGDQ